MSDSAAGTSNLNPFYVHSLRSEKLTKLPFSTTESVPMDGSSSSVGSQTSDRESPGTPTLNPRSFRKAPNNIPRSAPKVDSISRTGGAESSDAELSMTSDDLEDCSTSSDSNHSITKFYDQYDLDGISPQDFDLLLTLAPADQLPDLTTADVKPGVYLERSNSHAASRIAIKRYVMFHKFMKDPHSSHTTSQRRDFERNVYDFARANGLGKQEASSEVRKARMICGAPESDSEDSSFGHEVNDTSEILDRLAKTTFSYQDLQKEGKQSVRDHGRQIPSRVNQSRKRTRRGGRMDAEVYNAEVILETVEGAEHNGLGASGKASMESSKSQAIEVPMSTSSVPATDGRRSRRKRKRVDVEVAEDTMNQPSRRVKTSKHFPPINKESPTSKQRQPTSSSNDEAMEVDVVHAKVAENPQTIPTMPKNTAKATKRQAKRERRRQKHAAEPKKPLSSEVKKTTESKVSAMNVTHPSPAKDTASKPPSSEYMYLPPTEKKKRNKRESRPHDSESTVNAGASGSGQEEPADSKELGPNEPKSEQEAHQNFLRANIGESQEITWTADKSPLALADGKQSEFVEKLDALKRFSTENQVQLYDDGKYADADKQTKNDLKDLKEEKTAMEEMEIDNAKIDRSPDSKEKKNSRRSRVKREKAPKGEHGAPKKQLDFQ